jgi:putative solute:sodium symporter small subunit
MDKKDRYWEKNIRLVTGLLSLWASVSFGCGILLHNKLDIINLPGTHFPLGFWFAQQGAILFFIGIVFYYARRMNKIDDEYSEEE